MGPIAEKLKNIKLSQLIVKLSIRIVKITEEAKAYA